MVDSHSSTQWTSKDITGRDDELIGQLSKNVKELSLKYERSQPHA